MLPARYRRIADRKTGLSIIVGYLQVTFTSTSLSPSSFSFVFILNLEGVYEARLDFFSHRRWSACKNNVNTSIRDGRRHFARKEPLSIRFIATRKERLIYSINVSFFIRR